MRFSMGQHNQKSHPSSYRRIHFQHAIIFFFILLPLIPQNAMADFYVFGSYVYSQAKIYKGVQEIKGDGYTGGVGYKFGPLSTEGFYRKKDYDLLKSISANTGDDVTTDLSQSIIGVGGRFTLLFFLDLKGGLLFYDTDLLVKDGITPVSYKGGGNDYGYYAGLGIKLPVLGRLDIFADATMSYANDYDKNFLDIEGGLRFYF